MAAHLHNRLIVSTKLTFLTPLVSHIEITYIIIFMYCDLKLVFVFDVALHSTSLSSYSNKCDDKSVGGVDPT